MKVVKCEKHIPEELWGRVIKDDCIECKLSMNCTSGYPYYLIHGDTFPLPKQGDKVEVSDNGIEWDNGTCVYVSHYRGNHIIDDNGFIDDCKYIRPIEKEEVEIPSNQTIRTVLMYCLKKIRTMTFEDNFKSYES